MSKQDIRWEQRLNNYNKALRQLEKAVSLANERPLSDLEEQGLIQGFEFTHELAWKTIKDFIEDRGTTKIYGSKDATREAFALELIEDGEGWMAMIKSRNETSHTYNEETARTIAEAILDQYIHLFRAFRTKMEEKRSGTQGDLFS
jgi:nucleotidyltransferase substrate binding protein (TIGR01987 family)